MALTAPLVVDREIVTRDRKVDREALARHSRCDRSACPRCPIAAETSGVGAWRKTAIRGGPLPICRHFVHSRPLAASTRPGAVWGTRGSRVQISAPRYEKSPVFAGLFVFTGAWDVSRRCRIVALTPPREAVRRFPHSLQTLVSHRTQGCIFLALRGRTKVRHMEPEHLGVLSPRGARSWPQGNGATLRLHYSAELWA